MASIRDTFERIAPSYDRVNGILTFSLVKKYRRKLVYAIKPRAQLRVLDLCAGTLECTLEVLRQFPDASVVAVDFSGAMLERGLKKIPSPKFSQVSTICSDVLKINLPKNSFDVIICAWGIRNLEDKDLILQKAREWLSPGGQLIVLDIFKPNKFLKKCFFNSIGMHLVPLIGGFFAGDRAAYSYLIRSINENLSAEEFAALLTQEGFTKITKQNLFFGTHSLFGCINSG